MRQDTQDIVHIVSCIHIHTLGQYCGQSGCIIEPHECICTRMYQIQFKRIYTHIDILNAMRCIVAITDIVDTTLAARTLIFM